MALPINIDDLIIGSIVESERIEFKESWNPEDVLHTICAFANDIDNWGGGYIIIGIEEEDGRPVLPPKGLAIEQIDSIQNKLTEICYRITPNYFPVSQVAIYQGKHILILWVPGGDTRPYETPVSLGENRSDKAYYIRRTSRTIKAQHSDRSKLLELTAKIPFDDRINHHADISDLKLNHILTFLQEVKSGLFEIANSIPFQALCQQMKIVRGPVEYIKPINVGLLLFSDKPDEFFRGAKIEIVEYHEEVGDRYTEKEFTGPIHTQLRNALQYIQSNVLKEEVIKIPGQAESVRFFNYPYEAVEEALANAVFHRSYEHQSSIEVSIYHNCIKILSFPGPLAPVNNHQLKKDRIDARDYRNRRIGDFLKELRLTEGRGTGIPKIWRAMANNGSPQPILETNEDNNYFLVTLPTHPYFKRTIIQRSDGDILTLKTLEVLRFCQEPKSKREIMSHVGIEYNYYNSSTLLTPLLKAGYVTMTIPEKPNSSNQKYLTTPKGMEALQFKDNNYKLF